MWKQPEIINERSWVPIKLYFGTLKFKVHKIFMCHKIINFLFFKDFIIYLWREGKGGRKRRRETSCEWETSIGWCSYVPRLRPNLHSRHVPQLGIELATFCFGGCCPTIWATLVGTVFHIFKIFQQMIHDRGGFKNKKYTLLLLYSVFHFSGTVMDVINISLYFRPMGMIFQCTWRLFVTFCCFFCLFSNRRC